MSMQPYYTFAKDSKGKINAVQVQLADGSSAAIIDYYCTNPTCNCEEVLLELLEIRGEKTAERIASLRLKLDNWLLRDVKIDALDSKAEEYIAEFKTDLRPEFKELFKSRYREAKALPEKPAQPIVLDYRPGQCVRYTEVFPIEDPEKFQIQFMGNEYLVDDQYCIDPACKCNEAILTYIDLSAGPTAHRRRFALRLSLSTGTYTVELNDGGYTSDEIRQIHGSYMKHIHRDLGLFKRRYAKMKDYGKRFTSSINKLRPQNAPKVSAPKVGRNDPCPCGSGKKLKRCCGAR